MDAAVEVCVALKLDNSYVGQSAWKPLGKECWKEQFHIELDKSRELEVGVYWRDHRSLCGVAFLRLEEFLDNQRHQIQVPLEPQGCLFAEVSFLVFSYYPFVATKIYCTQILVIQ